MNKEDYKVYSDKMRKSIDAVNADFASVRAGRANASVLDRISVDYYGSPTPIQQIAAIASPDPRQLVITPWDGTALKPIERAIQESDLGINPQNDGKSIRLNFPQLTEERRKELVKQIHKYSETGKVAIRNIRRDAMDKFKAQKKKSEITEDELGEALKASIAAKATKADLDALTVRVGDIKADQHTDSTHRYRSCADGANVLEFIVETESLSDAARTAGTVSVYPELSGNIAAIEPISTAQ